LRTLKQEGTLYDVEVDNEEIKWLGDVTMHKEANTGSDQMSFLQKLQLDDDPTEKDDCDAVIDKEGTEEVFDYAFKIKLWTFIYTGWLYF